MNIINLFVLNDANSVTIIPTLMLLGTIVAVGFLIFYFSKVDQNKDRQLEELNQKLEEINRKLDRK